MGGGYISCGQWVGSDKSGSAISGVWRALETEYAGADLVERLRAWDDEAQRAFEGGSQEADIPAALAAELVDPLERYVADLGDRLGNPAHAEAPQLDARAGIPPIDAKWGAGDGWRYYCAVDLLSACRESVRTGEAVVIAFD